MAAHQAPLSLGFSTQEHWSGLPFPSPMHASKKWKWKWSRVWILATPWTKVDQAPPSMGFSRQESWNGVPLPSPRCILHSSKQSSHPRNIWQSQIGLSLILTPARITGNVHGLMHLWDSTWDLDCSRGKKSHFKKIEEIYFSTVVLPSDFIHFMLIFSNSHWPPLTF